jgi:hypothetical protein
MAVIYFISNVIWNPTVTFYLRFFSCAFSIHIFLEKINPNEYGGALPKIGMIFVGIKHYYLAFFFLPKHRDKIRYFFAFVVFFFFFFISILKMPSVNEYFWMNLRKYNFIAVNYLVYTTEVIGNIMESYPVVPIFRIIYNKGYRYLFYFKRIPKLYWQHPYICWKIIRNLLCLVWSVVIGDSVFRH